MDRGEASAAEIYADGFCVDEQVRRTFEIDVDAATVTAMERSIASARLRVAEFFGIGLVGQEGPGFLRYPRGGFYRTHRDIAADGDPQFARRISVVLFLTSAGSPSDDAWCAGGELRLYDTGNAAKESDSLEILPAAGTLVAFPATLLHEVLPVTGGVRDAVVDWFY